MRTVLAIKRTDRSDRAHWVPVKTNERYQLVNREIPYPNRNLVAYATFVRDLDQAGELIGKGYAIRMAEPGATRGDYIYPENLEVILA
jgi:hypothetical protein